MNSNGGTIAIGAVGTGTLDMTAGGVVNAGSGAIDIGSLGAVLGAGTLTASAIVNSGAVDASGGNLLINGAITGTGTLEIETGATLAVGDVAATDTIAFGNDVLQMLALQTPGEAEATIQNFYAGSTIDLPDLTGLIGSWNQVNSTGGVLTLTDGTSGPVIAALNISGMHSGFTLHEDGSGGTDVLANDTVTFAWNASSGAWSTAGNWTNLTSSTAGPPGSADAAEFESGAGTISGSGEAGTLDLLGGTWTMDGNVNVADDTAVGVDAIATLFIDGGGTVDAGGTAAIAASTGSAGSSVSVVGANSTWQVTGTLDIGEAAEGSLTVVSQGSVAASGVDVGVTAGAVGVITVSGVGSNITDGGELSLGDAGVAELSITDGADITAVDVDLGVQGSGSGNVDIEGAGSTLNITDNLNIGDLGLGVLTIGQGATLAVVNNLNQGANGVLNVAGGIIDPASGTLSGTTNISVGGAITYTGTLTLKGTINVQGGTGTLNVGTLTGAGDLNVGTDGIFVLADGTGGENGPTLIGASVPVITFADNTGTMTVKDAAVLGTLEITAFNAGDKVELPNLVFTGTTIVTAGTIDLVNAGGTIVGDVLYGGTVVGATLAAGIVGAAPCFAAGTRIATTRGPVAVEQLGLGAAVRLARGGTAPVLWLGHRTVDCSRHPRPRDVMPVRVMADAFGPGQPSGELLLSPDHAVFIDGVLIPVRYLLNGATVVQEAVVRVTYWHVELDHHDVLLAEGLACESYLDTGNRGAFANGGGATMMHADFALRVWERESCAPLVVDGAELEAARSYLLERAHGLGFTVTADPDLHLLAGGETLWPQAVAGGVYRFALPANADALVIASRSAIPGEMADVYDDGRRLGVMLGRITFLQDGVACEVALAGLPDDAGFHALEGDGGSCWRWTDGNARLEVPAGFAPDAPLTLELHVAASRPAWVAPAHQPATATGNGENTRAAA